MDECWISLPYDEDDAVSVAEEIRQTVKDETGLTVSIGASFSKALAKLGSFLISIISFTCSILQRSGQALVIYLPCFLRRFDLHPPDIFKHPADEYGGFSSSDTLLSNIYAVPGQTKQFANTQRTGES